MTEISAGSLPAPSAAGKAAAPSFTRGTPCGAASLLYLNVKERVAGTRGKSADKNYRRRINPGQTLSPTIKSDSDAISSEIWRR